MFTLKNLKSGITLLVLLQSIALSGTLATPSLAQEAGAETTVKPVETMQADKVEDSAQSKAKLALVQGAIEASGTVVRHSGKAAKVEPSLPNYKQIEDFSFDMGGNLPGAGI
jgi:hypothetical protein